jgi:hypothetical protein
VAAKVAIRQVRQQPDLAERWTKILKRITSVAPDLLVVWSDLASLHIAQSQFDQALECFEVLQVKLPGNLEIQDAIEQTKARVSTP